MIKMTCICEDT